MKQILLLSAILVIYSSCLFNEAEPDVELEVCNTDTSSVQFPNKVWTSEQLANDYPSKLFLYEGQLVNLHYQDGLYYLTFFNKETGEIIDEKVIALPNHRTISNGFFIIGKFLVYESDQYVTDDQYIRHIDMMDIEASKITELEFLSSDFDSPYDYKWDKNMFKDNLIKIEASPMLTNHRDIVLKNIHTNEKTTILSKEYDFDLSRSAVVWQANNGDTLVTIKDLSSDTTSIQTINLRTQETVFNVEDSKKYIYSKIKDEIIYIRYTHELIAIDHQTNQELWRAIVPVSERDSRAVGTQRTKKLHIFDNLIFEYDNGRLTSFDKSTGEKLWAGDNIAGSFGSDNVFLHQNQLYSSSIVKINALNGCYEWKEDIPFDNNDFSSNCVVENDLLFIKKEDKIVCYQL